MSSAKKRKIPPESSEKKIKIDHYWSDGLKASMNDPDLLVESDDLVVIIKDKYPKAKKHFLVLPKEYINSLRDVRKEHLPLLKYMNDKAVEFCLRLENEMHDFRIGFHAVPSMSPLHLHLISQDFESPFLKTKKHWNSFNSNYFIDSKDFLQQVEEFGKIIPMDPQMAKDLLKQNLRCHICNEEIKNMPKLKVHIKRHYRS